MKSFKTSKNNSLIIHALDHHQRFRFHRKPIIGSPRTSLIISVPKFIRSRTTDCILLSSYEPKRKRRMKAHPVHRLFPWRTKGQGWHIPCPLSINIKNIVCLAPLYFLPKSKMHHTACPILPLKDETWNTEKPFLLLTAVLKLKWS